MSNRGRGKLGVILGFLLSWVVSATRQKNTQHPRTQPKGEARPASLARAEADHTSDLDARLHHTLQPSYSPQLDGDADPGEVIWTWVPYVENDGRGKDRPVLIIARLSNGDVAGCALSTKQHRGYIPIGSGGWDTSGRDSYLNADRLLRVPQASMRREGQVLPREKYTEVVKQLSQRYGFAR